MIKILQLGKFYPPFVGGIESVMFDITNGLNNHNCIKCDVLCSNTKAKYSEDTVGGYKVMRTKSYGLYFSTSISPQMIFKLRSIISKYDIIHVHSPDPMSSLALFFTDLKDKKIVLHWHSDIVKQKFLLKLYLPLQNWIMKRADSIIATTPKYIEESKFLHKFKNKCIAIPIGINNSKIVVKQSCVNKIKNKYNGKKIIFSLGRLVYYKGFEYLIKSARYLSDDYVILIGGDGELHTKLQKIIYINNLQNKVILLGKINDSELGSFYESCDIFCLPSIYKSEAFGVVQLEAMSFSKPIVSTRISGSGVDWVNKDGFSGISVEIKDSKMIAKAFQDILLDKEKYIEYKSNSNHRFKELFTQDRMVSDIIKLYKSMIIL